MEAVVLVRGRIAGTWRYDRRASGLRVRVTPFARWTSSVSRVVEKRAAAIAEFFGLSLASFEIADA